MTLNEVLIWILNSGGGIVVVTWVLQRIPAFINIVSAATKQYIFFGSALFVNLIAFAVLNYVPPEILAQLTPWFAVLYGTFFSVFLGNAFNKFDKKFILKIEK